MRKLKLLVFVSLIFRTSIGFTQWTTSGTDIYYNSGNVGIGTGTPTALLHVDGGNAIINTVVVGRGNNSGTGNVAMGGGALSNALASQTYNVAIGSFALNTTSSSTSHYNVGVGSQALRYLTSGNLNVAAGNSALVQATSGGNNVAIGYSAGNRITTGTSNLAVGYNSLPNNRTGFSSLAIGRNALPNIGFTSFAQSWNIGIGFAAGGGIVTGTQNTIIGANIGGLSSTLSNNIIIGDGAGNQRINVGSTGNVGMGVSAPTTKLQVAGVISSASDGVDDLGSGALRFKDVYATNGTIQTSDAREKKEIYNLESALNFINNLRPVSFKWKKIGDESKHYGFIAQEVRSNKLDSRTHESLPIVTQSPNSRFGIRYEEMISPVISAIQKISNKCNANKSELMNLEIENAKLIQMKNSISVRVENIKTEHSKLFKSEI